MKQTATLKVSGGRIRIEWDDGDFAELLARFFAPWRTEDTGGTTGATYTVAVSAGSDGYRMTSPLSPPVTCTTLPELAVELESKLTGLALTMLEPALLVHSAVVDLNGRGALIAGDHGAGKTTLTLTAMSSGFRALSDEVGIIRSDLLTLDGFPRPFHVSADVAGLEPAVMPGDCEPYAITDDFSLVFFDRRYQPSSTLSCILFPDRRPGNTIVSGTGELEALRRLLPLGFNFYRAADGRAGDLVRMLKTVKAYTLRYEDHWEAVSVIKGLIEET